VAKLFSLTPQSSVVVRAPKSGNDARFLPQDSTECRALDFAHNCAITPAIQRPDLMWNMVARVKMPFSGNVIAAIKNHNSEDT
jgi:hypothetical protein